MGGDVVVVGAADVEVVGGRVVVVVEVDAELFSKGALCSGSDEHDANGSGTINPSSIAVMSCAERGQARSRAVIVTIA